MTSIKFPSEYLFGTWTINRPTASQLAQLPPFQQKQANKIKAGTALKYFVAALSCGVQKSSEGFLVNARVDEVRKCLGDSGNNHGLIRAGLVAAQNLLFRPSKEIEGSGAISLQRIITKTTADPRQCGDLSEIKFVLEEQFGRALTENGQYSWIDLNELGQIRQSGNIFIYLSFLRYAGLKLPLGQAKLASLLARPDESPEERIRYYFSHEPARRWSLLRKDLSEKISNIQKRTKLRVSMKKPSRSDKVSCSITYLKQDVSIDSNSEKQLVKLSKLYGIKVKSGIAKLKKHGVPEDFNRRVNFIIENIDASTDSDDFIGKLNGRAIGPGLIMQFICGDDVFQEYIVEAKADPANKKKADRNSEDSNVDAENNADIFFNEHLRNLCHELIDELGISSEEIANEAIKIQKSPLSKNITDISLVAMVNLTRAEEILLNKYGCESKEELLNRLSQGQVTLAS